MSKWAHLGRKSGTYTRCTHTDQEEPAPTLSRECKSGSMEGIIGEVEEDLHPHLSVRPFGSQ